MNYTLWDLLLILTWLYGGVLVIVWLYRFISNHYLRYKEKEILRRKFGDIPMFEDFFRRMDSDDKGRRN